MINALRRALELGLAILRCALGLRCHDRHVFFVEDGSTCWRDYVLAGRWVLLRRSTCHNLEHPHELAVELAYRNGARFNVYVGRVRATLLGVALALAFAGSWVAWQQHFLGRLPGTHGEALPRDWRSTFRCYMRHRDHVAFYLRRCSTKSPRDLYGVENVVALDGGKFESGQLIGCPIDGATLDGEPGAFELVRADVELVR